MGSVCLALAALIYFVPLQVLLRDLRSKGSEHGHGSGALLALALLVPMWLLLLGALAALAARGAFDDWMTPRAAVYALLVSTVLAMAVVSLARLEFVPRSNRLTRLLAGAPLHLCALSSMALALLGLHPSVAPNVSRELVRIPFAVCGALSLACLCAFLVRRFAHRFRLRTPAIVRNIRTALQQHREKLERIPRLDPSQQFADLVALTTEYQPRKVRAAALSRAQSAPDFVARLAHELELGKAEHALAMVEIASLSPADRTSVAASARRAMDRITDEVLGEIRYFPQTRRKRMLRWGRRLFRAVAERLANAGTDFTPSITRFEQTLTATSPTED